MKELILFILGLIMMVLVIVWSLGVFIIFSLPCGLANNAQGCTPGFPFLNAFLFWLIFGVPGSWLTFQLWKWADKSGTGTQGQKPQDGHDIVV